MGLAASQGRYLCLTARMNDLIFEGQQISQQRLNLAKETQQIADEYSKATNNKKMVANVYLGDNKPTTQVDLTYSLITTPSSEYGLGYRIVDKFGAVVIPSTDQHLEIETENDDGTISTEKVYNKNNFIEKYFSDLSLEEKSKLQNFSMYDLKEEYAKRNPDSTIKMNLKSSYPTSILKENDSLCIDEYVTDKDYLQNMLATGEYTLQRIEDPETKKWADFEWQASNDIIEIYDTSDDAAAESKYESAMKELEKRDKLLELRLEQVQTEEKAVEKELESVKNVINKNIENSFKTFA